MSRSFCIALTLVALVWAPFGCDLDNSENDTTSQDTVFPPEDTVVPPEDTVVPPEDTIVPPEDTVVSPEDTLVPPEDTIVPPEDTIVPPEDTFEPPEDMTQPPDCIEEGETGPVIMPPMECCEGLELISVAIWDPDVPDICGFSTGVILCSKCGNGNCEWDWENPCNCPEDCKASDPGGDQALCAETGGTWTDCGSGCGPWACGTPFPEICPAVCITQCNCPAGDGWDPQKGCVTCTCDEWFETWAALLAQVQACQSPDDCIDVPGTSCGCTMNYVVNKSAGLWFFWQIGELMGAAGCSPFMSTCSCPPVDGFKCENGTCAWNYL